MERWLGKPVSQLVQNMHQKTYQKSGGTATRINRQCGRINYWRIFTDNEENIEQEAAEMTQQLSVDNGRHTQALATDLV